METIIHNRMPVVLKNMQDICVCERCQLDILACALNNMPPRYVVTLKGSFYTKLSILEGQFDVDVVRAITDAAVRIAKDPRHDE
jgi:competence protein ComFB